jgi:hypothetical protein
MESLQTFTEIFNNLITPIGIILGGLWAYRKFRTKNEGQWNANLNIESKIIKSESDENIVSVIISINNIGNYKITPTQNGLKVSLFKIASNLSESCIVDEWVEIQDFCKDILSIYKNDDEDYSEAWNLDFGATYTERVILKIKEKGLYKLKCRLHIKDKKMPNKENWLTEYDYFIIK